MVGCWHYRKLGWDPGLIPLLYSRRSMARDPIHPGRFLADELETLDMSVPQVAEILHVPANRIYQLLKGQRALTADTALRLSQWLGTSAEMWLNLQKLYELRLAEQQAGETIKRTVARRETVQAA
jgi:addiction module HigA family antidote